MSERVERGVRAEVEREGVRKVRKGERGMGEIEESGGRKSGLS